jgi:hypothetical protein
MLSSADWYLPTDVSVRFGPILKDHPFNNNGVFLFITRWKNEITHVLHPTFLSVLPVGLTFRITFSVFFVRVG